MRVRIVTLGLLLLLAAGPARADGYEETEYRLKTAGIQADLRERIHEGIRRAVAHLRARQRPDGSFKQHTGNTALAGLALRHAGIPDGVEGGRAAIRWLTQTKRKPASSNTYIAGITAMLLMADRSENAWNHEIHDLLARAPQKDAGYWGYASRGGASPANLSTAQFGCLGLWAGERAGARVAKKAWRLHLDALLGAQQSDGSWGYAPGPALGAWGQGYPTGTYMGLANLTLAREALRDEIRQDPSLWTRVLLTAGSARGALRRHVAWEFEAVSLPVFGGFWTLYRLYALEKVCVFLDLEEVAGRRWYEEGARRLLAAQSPGGSGGASRWRTHAPGFPTMLGDPVDTSFALLFLLRASHSYHPVTPRPVDRAPVITPGDDPTEPAPAPEPPITSLEDALAVLDAFDAWLVQRRLDTPGRALDAFRAIRRIWPEYRPAGTPRSEPHDAWCRRAQALLLRAATRFVRARAGERPRWQAIAIEALDTLATTDRRIGPALMRAVETVERGAAFPEAFRLGWYSAALDALRRVEAPALAPWLVERLLSPDRKEHHRTSAALTVLGGIHGLRGRQRHAAVKGILTRLAPLLGKSGGDPITRDLQVDALVAVHRLAAPHANDFPELRAATMHAATMRTMARSVQSWWRMHRSRSNPAWSD